MATVTDDLIAARLLASATTTAQNAREQARYWANEAEAAERRLADVRALMDARESHNTRQEIP